MIEKQIVLGKVEILEDGQIQVRQDTIILEDGVELTRTYHRAVLEPGQVVTPFAQKVQAVAAAVWTPDVVAAFQDAKRKRQLPSDVKGSGIASGKV